MSGSSSTRNLWAAIGPLEEQGVANQSPAAGPTCTRRAGRRWWERRLPRQSTGRSAGEHGFSLGALQAYGAGPYRTASGVCAMASGSPSCSRIFARAAPLRRRQLPKPRPARSGSADPQNLHEGLRREEPQSWGSTRQARPPRTSTPCSHRQGSPRRTDSRSASPEGVGGTGADGAADGGRPRPRRRRRFRRCRPRRRVQDERPPGARTCRATAPRSPQGDEAGSGQHTSGKD